jgi:hypothetical protein
MVWVSAVLKDLSTNRKSGHLNSDIVGTTHILVCQTEFEPQPGKDVVLRRVC